MRSALFLFALVLGSATAGSRGEAAPRSVKRPDAAEETRIRRCVEALAAAPARRPALARVFVDGEGNRMPYRLWEPVGAARRRYPLVVSLHHAAARGGDNELQVKSHAYGLGRFVAAETQAAHPSYVLAPHAPERWGDLSWSATPAPPRALAATMPRRLAQVFGIVDALLADPVHGPRIDRSRIYLTGQSMGGYGTWEALLWRPELFAAAIPVCGGGHALSAGRAAAVPIWTFHGTADDVIHVSHTAAMADGLQRAGGNVLYWEYEGLDHNQTSERAYCEPELVPWLFAQRRPTRARRAGD